LQLVFRGKHGSATNVKVQDTRLRRVVRACQDLPGQTLFQYRDEDGRARPVTSTDVNEYLRAASGLDISAKDFRTWMGTLLAAITLVDMSNEEASATRRRRTVKQAMEQVSDALRNTPTVARASYVHPAVVECSPKNESCCGSSNRPTGIPEGSPPRRERSPGYRLTAASSDAALAASRCTVSNSTGSHARSSASVSTSRQATGGPGRRATRP
jgi:DNA topoisomerase-1